MGTAYGYAHIVTWSMIWCAFKNASILGIDTWFCLTDEHLLSIIGSPLWHTCNHPSTSNKDLCVHRVDGVCLCKTPWAQVHISFLVYKGLYIYIHIYIYIIPSGGPNTLGLRLPQSSSYQPFLGCFSPTTVLLARPCERPYGLSMQDRD